MSGVHDVPDDALPTPAGKVRLDKWLWAARFFKTRALAADAIDGGKVDVNGDRAKRAKQVQAGDVVRLRQGPVEWVLAERTSTTTSVVPTDTKKKLNLFRISTLMAKKKKPLRTFPPNGSS